MKKIIKTVLTFIIGALVGLCVFLFTGDGTALESYVENTLVPNAVLALSTTGGILAAAYPTLNNVHNTLTRFNGAADAVNKTAKESEATSESVEKYKEELTAKINEEFKSYKETLESFIGGYGEKLSGIIDTLSTLKGDIIDEEKMIEAGEEDIKKMLLLAFANTDELVKKGFAREITKVVEGDGGEEKEG